MLHSPPSHPFLNPFSEPMHKFNNFIATFNVIHGHFRLERFYLRVAGDLALTVENSGGTNEGSPVP